MPIKGTGPGMSFRLLHSNPKYLYPTYCHGERGVQKTSVLCLTLPCTISQCMFPEAPVSQMTDSFHKSKTGEMFMLSLSPEDSVYMHDVLQISRSPLVKTFLDLLLTQHFQMYLTTVVPAFVTPSTSWYECFADHTQGNPGLLCGTRHQFHCSNTGKGSGNMSSSWAMHITQLIFHIYITFLLTTCVG